ncbi:bifunctional transaldolase/phosoglucose isomerase [Oecophyllibacter saccharovorans]|uniref:Transaldolase n=1 Tax=Oecophyllibacter saccharovorans TaxID=2558360 RepID=A0A506UM38_9PROT|nr:bifunctional transaldolase/phosoglucose isomerase [Oecophyllibacter saccharovorans]TPW34375.1 bifunctional transaldolase/phosoglucose isomerase [Oecophyllibacter saccharovorans]
MAEASAGRTDNPLKRLAGCGQAPWLDFISRDFIASGDLYKLVQEDGITGVTSNPAIFEKAIGQGEEYAPEIARLLQEDKLLRREQIYERLAIEDIRGACEVLKPVYEATSGRDGYVSFEVSPFLAHDSWETEQEAHRLWEAVDRPNLMIKLPATDVGVEETKTLTAQGINVNVTLLFSVATYARVLEAYLRGLEQRVARGKDIRQVAGVASFFISRIDSAVDGEIDRRLAEGDPDSAALKALRGKVAVACGVLAYAHLQEVLASPRWAALAAKGAQPQRLLWASTSTKDKAYSDTKYVEALIGPHTVDTLPPATLAAFRDHGTVRQSLPGDVEAARAVIAEAERLGLDLPKMSEKLLAEGCTAFEKAFETLLDAVEARRMEVLGISEPIAPKLISCKAAYPLWVEETASCCYFTPECEDDELIQRIWARDPKVWTGGKEGEWLGWLSAPRDGLEHIKQYEDFARDVKAGGYTDVLLLGMGGSSLGPEVLKEVFGHVPGWPELHVLDSTDPEQVAEMAAKVDLAKTLFIVSSKSGSTLEPNILFAYFWAAAEKALGKAPGAHFVAVTDPNSSMEKTAKEHGFGHIFFGNAQIGGRYSVLSPFGMVPAAAAGYNVRGLLENALLMADQCNPEDAWDALSLGKGLGCVGSGSSSNKVTFVGSGKLAAVGPWLEQLLAESTGKQGKALIPIIGEAPGAPDKYGEDRFFIDLRMAGETQDPKLKALLEVMDYSLAPDWVDEKYPGYEIQMDNLLQLGQVFYLFEFATAVAAAMMEINPFDQPDVEASKVETRKLLSTYEQTGKLPPEEPFAVDGDLAFYADPRNAEALKKAAGGRTDAVSLLKAQLERVKPGDYVGLLAYIARTPGHIAWAQEVRHMLRDGLHVATAAEFGPRFLHSTGQAYKGGPNTGVFLQVTSDKAKDLEIPGHPYTFGVVQAAQARGDFDVLAARDRRALRVHIRGPLEEGLKKLSQALQIALKEADHVRGS